MITKTKIIIALVLTSVALAGCLSIQHNRVEHYRADNQRLQRNVNSLLSTSRQRFVRDSLRGVEVDALVLKVREMANLRAEDAQLIKDLKIRLRDAKSMTKVVAVYKDTVIMRVDTVVEKERLTYNDEWANISFNPVDSTLAYTFRDSISSLLHVEYEKRFLWWRWRPHYNVTTVSHNPRCTAISGETIIIEK